MSHSITQAGTSSTGRTGAADGTGSTPGSHSLGELVALASRDLSVLVQDEIALAKAELKKEAASAAKGGAMFAAAGVLAAVGGLMLCFAAAWAIDLVLPTWAGFAIVAVLFFGAAGLLGLVGKGAFGKIGAPERTLRTLSELPQAFKPSKS